MSTVVDASVVVDWVAPDADPHSPAVGLLESWVRRDEEVVAPGLLRVEVGNALLTGIRRGRWDGAAADTAWNLLLRLPVRIVDDDREVRAAWELARRYDEHPLQDMVYVALAKRLGTTLHTTDGRLLRRVGQDPTVVAVS